MLKLPALLGPLLLLSFQAGCNAGGGSSDADPPPPPAEKVTRADALDLKGDIQSTHDPVIAKADGRYYVFSTHEGIKIKCSDNLTNWVRCGSVFENEAPDWVKNGVQQGLEPDLWAPDLSFFNGTYHLYYSASQFGTSRSAIGVATSPTLDSSSPDYAWTDQQKVVETYNSDDYNAIDPNVVLGEQGQPWLSFGSFWSGIKMVRLDPETGKRSSEDETLYALAARPDDPAHAVEAPFIIREGNYYYLFVSFDRCCRGADSDYNIRVGRSQEVTGPYVDRSGTPMMEGGGTLVLSGSARWRGTGHNGVLQEDGNEYLVYHAYDAENGGVPTLRISPITWESGWPTIEKVTVTL